MNVVVDRGGVVVAWRPEEIVARAFVDPETRALVYRAIYEHLLATYELDPAETIFIDDVDVNVAAAARFGIRTIRFENRAQCEAELRRLGCL